MSGGHPAAQGYDIKITGAGLMVGLTGLVCLAAGMAQRQAGVGLLGGTALALLLGSFLLRPAMAWGVRLTGPARCIEGEIVEHLVSVVNNGRTASPPAHLRVGLQGFAPVEVAVPALPSGGTLTTPVLMRPVRRGACLTQQVTWATDAPFGLVKRVVGHARRVAFIVHPARRDPVPLLGGRPGGDRFTAVPDRSGAPYHALRDFRPGDSSRDVHWRSTAKRGRLVVVERELVETPEPLVVVCGPSARAGTDRVWEQVIGRAAWSLAAAVQRGQRPRLVVAVGEHLQEVRLETPAEALDAVALIAVAAVLSGRQIKDLAARDPRGTPVVVFTAPHATGVVEAFAAQGRPVTLVTS